MALGTRANSWPKGRSIARCRSCGIASRRTYQSSTDQAQPVSWQIGILWVSQCFCCSKTRSFATIFPGNLDAASLMTWLIPIQSPKALGTCHAMHVPRKTWSQSFIFQLNIFEQHSLVFQLVDFQQWPSTNEASTEKMVFGSWHVLVLALALERLFSKAAEDSMSIGLVVLIC